MNVTGTVRDYADDALVERAVRNAGRVGNVIPRWSAVSNSFGLGSTYSAQLCRRFGLDPDEMVGTEDDGRL